MDLILYTKIQYNMNDCTLLYFFSLSLTNGNLVHIKQKPWQTYANIIWDLLSRWGEDN